MSGSVVVIDRDPVYQGIQGQALRSSGIVQVVVLQQVSGLTALITGGGHPLVAEVIFCTDCVVRGIFCRPCCGQSGQVNAAWMERHGTGSLGLGVGTRENKIGTTEW